MLKLVIADASEAIVQTMSRHCKKLFDVYICTNGQQALEAVRKFQPDILLLDLHLPELDGLTVLRTIRTSGNDIPVIMTGFLHNDWVFAEMSELRVNGFFPKPCHTGAVVAHLQDLAMHIQSGMQLCQSPQRAANHILLNLGFRMGLSRYQCVYQALMLKYEGEDGGVTKCLYPKVGMLCGGNAAQVEKAIRDAINNAFCNGNPNIWKMYFKPGCDEQMQCPSNEVFLSRIAFALQEQFQVIPNQIAQ